MKGGGNQEKVIKKKRIAMQSSIPPKSIKKICISFWFESYIFLPTYILDDTAAETEDSSFFASTNMKIYDQWTIIFFYICTVARVHFMLYTFLILRNLQKFRRNFGNKYFLISLAHYSLL